MITLTFIFVIFCSILTAPPSGGLTVFVAEPARPYEAIWKATKVVETNNDPYAVGDKHLYRWSYGIVQVRKVRLDDYYQKTGIRYSENDMLDTVKAKNVFMFYAMQIHHTDRQRMAREWNGGPKGMQKSSTKSYWRKIETKLKMYE